MWVNTSFKYHLLGKPHFIFGLFTLCVSSIALAAESDPLEKRIIDANRTEASYNSSSQFIRNTELDSYLSGLIQRITSQVSDASSINFRIHAMDNLYPYVYCLDNGAVYISTGLLARLQNESQLVGLLALEMASVIRQDREAKSELYQKQSAPKRMIPNLVLIAATAGLGAIPIVQKDTAERDKLTYELQLASDKLAIELLQKANFNPGQTVAALQRLSDTLVIEQRFGSADLSSKTYLDRRIPEVQQVLTGIDVAGPFKEDNQTFKRYAKHYANVIAESDKNNNRKELFNIMVQRIDDDFGASGITSYLRADLARQSLVDDSGIPEVIKLYEKSITFADVPAVAWKEVALLHRKLGNKESARSNFATYLKKQPNAADAIIIRSYMENL